MRLRRPRPSGLIAMAAAGCLSAWLIASHDSPPSLPPADALPAAATTNTEPHAAGLTAQELASRSRSLGQPVYWAGARPGRHYELRSDAQTGAAVVRYVAAAGAEPDLVVATIPLQDAFAKTEARAGQPDAVSKRLLDGGIAWSGRERPLTAYVAHAGVDYVVEVDAGEEGLARQLAFSGEIQPIR